MDVLKTLAIIASCIVLATVTAVPYFYSSSSSSGGDQTVHNDYGKEHKNIPLPKTPNYRKLISECGSINYRAIECDICKLFVSGLKNLVKKGSTQEDIVLFATKICSLFAIEDQRVCARITVEFKVRCHRSLFSL